MSYRNGKEVNNIFITYATLTLIKEVFLPRINDNIKVNVADGLRFSLLEQPRWDNLDTEIEQVFAHLKTEDKDLEEIQTDIQNLVRELNYGSE